MITDDEKDVKIWGGRQAAGDLIVQVGTARTDSDGAASQRLLSLVTDINGTPSEKAYVDGAGAIVATAVTSSGSTKLSALAGTPASGTGITLGTSAELRSVVHKITADYTAFQTAGTTNDVTLWTLPAKTRILRIIGDVTTKFLGGAISAVVMRVGKAANGAEYLLDKDVFTAAVTAGDAAAEIGASLLSATVADITWASTQAVVMRLTSTTANLSALTQGSVSLYIECAVYP